MTRFNQQIYNWMKYTIEGYKDIDTVYIRKPVYKEEKCDFCNKRAYAEALFGYPEYDEADYIWEVCKEHYPYLIAVLKELAKERKGSRRFNRKPFILEKDLKLPRISLKKLFKKRKR